MAQYTRVGKRRPAEQDDRVYASLDELVRLQFQASGFSFLPRQPIHSLLAGRHASRLRGRGLNFEELRDYLPGDDIRTIDWKVTARTDTPHVRVHTEERDRPVWLLVDQRRSMFFGSRWKMKSVAAAEAAALAAWRVLAAGDRVGAMVFDDSRIVTVPPHRSRERVLQILSAIVERNHALRAERGAPPGAGMIDEVLRRLAPLARHDCLLVLVTDGLGIDEGSRSMATRLTEHNDMLGLFVFDPLERGLEDSGRLSFSDGTRTLEVDTGRRRVRESYGADFEARLAALRALSRRSAVPLLELDASLPLLEQVRRQLGYVPRRNARR